MEEVRMKAAVTSARAMSSSYPYQHELHAIDGRTNDLPSTHPLIHPLIPIAPLKAPSNSSIPVGQYPMVASGVSNASDASSQTNNELEVGE